MEMVSPHWWRCWSAKYQSRHRFAYCHWWSPLGCGERGAGRPLGSALAHPVVNGTTSSEESRHLCYGSWYPASSL